MTEPDQWRLSLKIAVAVLQKDCAIPDPTGGALWYHADFTRPAWAVGYESTTIIGNHVFYRDADGQHGRSRSRKAVHLSPERVRRIRAGAQRQAVRPRGRAQRRGDTFHP